MPTYLGMNAKLYRGTAAAAATAVSTEVTGVKSVTLSLEAGDADVTVRGNNGWRTTAPTLKDASVEFEIPASSVTATDVKFFMERFLDGASFALLIMDQDKATTGAQGLLADFTCSSCSRSEPLEEAITYSIKCKPTLSSRVPPISWYEKTGT